MKQQKRITKKEALRAAYDIVFLVNDQISNIIATHGDDDEEEAKKRDLEIKEKIDIFLDWYKKQILQ